MFTIIEQPNNIDRHRKRIAEDKVQKIAYFLVFDDSLPELYMHRISVLI